MGCRLRRRPICRRNNCRRFFNYLDFRGKYLERASYDMIKAELEGTFQGGRSLLLSVKDDGVGIPEKNPNLSDEVQAKVNEIFQKMKAGEIVVSSEQGNLFK